MSSQRCEEIRRTIEENLGPRTKYSEIVVVSKNMSTLFDATIYETDISDAAFERLCKMRNLNDVTIHALTVPKKVYDIPEYDLDENE